jgi:hypothetical protein
MEMSHEEITLLISSKIAEGKVRRDKALEDYRAEQREAQRLSLKRLAADLQQKLRVAIGKIPDAVFADEHMVPILSVKLNDPSVVKEDYDRSKTYLSNLLSGTNYSIFEAEIDLCDVANTRTLYLVFRQEG